MHDEFASLLCITTFHYLLLQHHYYVSLHHYYIIINHYYIIITSLLRHYFIWRKQVIMSSLLRIIHFRCFHYNIVIPHYYHYYPLLHVTNWATCRCGGVIGSVVCSEVLSAVPFLKACPKDCRLACGLRSLSHVPVHTVDS